MNLKNTIIAAGILALTTPMMASAIIKTNQVSEEKSVVLYTVSELETETGRAQIKRQVKRAARRLCGPVDIRQAGSLKHGSVNKACFNNAVDNAMERVYGSSVTAD